MSQKCVEQVFLLVEQCTPLFVMCDQLVKGENLNVRSVIVVLVSIVRILLRNLSLDYDKAGCQSV